MFECFAKGKVGIFSFENLLHVGDVQMHPHAIKIVNHHIHRSVFFQNAAQLFENAARALGIDVARYKLAAFVVSAVYAAVAGSLFVHIVGFVSPEVFGMNMVILGFTMLYVGGIGTITGPLVGAIVINLLPETMRGLKDYQDLVYGAALILLLIYAPEGLAALGWSKRKPPSPEQAALKLASRNAQP